MKCVQFCVHFFSCVITAHCSILTCPYLRASSLPHTTLLRPYLERGRRIPSHSLGAFFWNSMIVQSWFDLLSPKYLAFSMSIWFFCNMLHTVCKCEYFPATHILHEINFQESRSSKHWPFCSFSGSEFWFWWISAVKKWQKFIKI